MPKLLVLFQSSDSDVVRLAAAAAEGARSVRFAEVDLRQLPGPDDAAGTASAATGRTHHRLEHVDAIGQYDGVVLAIGQNGEGVQRALDGLGGALANKVGSAVTPARGDERRTVLWSVLTPMADRGMILVPAPFTDESAGSDEPVRALGKRVAEVIGWVTHARSHRHH